MIWGVNGIQHNDTQHNGLICDTQHDDSQHNGTQFNDMEHSKKQNVTLNITTLSIMAEYCYAQFYLC